MIDEILVHISTPATKQNDDLYRSLADAYLNFELHNRIGDETRQELEAQNVPSLAHPQNPEGPQADLSAERSMMSTSKESYGSFPSYISSAEQLSGSGRTGTQSKSCFTQNETAPTSSRLARLDQIHMHWKEQTTPKSSFVGGSRSSGRVLRSTADADTGFIEDTQLGAHALQSQMLDYESVTSEDSSSDETRVSEHQPAGTSKKSARAAGDIENTELPSAWDTIMTRAVLQRSNVGSPEAVTKPPPPVEQQAWKKQKTVNNPSILSETYDFSHLSLDAFPPAPKISIDCPNKLPSQITRHLAAIRAQNPKRYRTSEKLDTRGSQYLKPDDRGYWSIVCSKWPVKVQIEFWTSLCEHVTSGNLGWGITLHRDAFSPMALGRVRVYCWHEVVEHIWLLLWLCSKGEIVGSNSKWIDADGVTCFEVE